MAPAARLSLPYGKRMPNISIAPARFRVQGWDPLLIISQIVSLQSLHYLSLALILPPLLHLFASSSLLAYEGGASSVTMVMDWREFSGIATSSLAEGKFLTRGLVGLTAVASGKGLGGTGVGGKLVEGDVARGLTRVVESDPLRGWAVAIGWMFASMIDVVYLYHLVRRPTHILDFSLTLIFNHLILTTYYSSSFPSSFFFWFILTISTIAQIVLAEQWCVRREMREGFTIDPTAGTSSSGGGNGRSSSPERSRRGEDLEMGKVGSGHTRGGGGSKAGMGSGSYERVPMEERQD